MKRKRTMIGREATLVEESDGLIALIARAFDFFFTNCGNKVRAGYAHPRMTKKLYKNEVNKVRKTKGNRIIYSGRPNVG